MTTVSNALNHKSTVAKYLAILAMTVSVFPAIGYTQTSDTYFPKSDDEWRTITPHEAQWSESDLERALDYAGERNSSGVVILFQGKILAERYWDIEEPSQRYLNFVQGRDPSQRVIEDVASAQKSIAAILTGIAQERGYLDIDDPVSQHLGQGWSKASIAQENKITLKHLLSMTSGLNPDLSFDVEPGTKWVYNTPAYHHVMKSIEAATGRDRNSLTTEWLTGPLGMSNSSWTPRPWASSDIGVGFSTTARDLARVGVMIHSNGYWDGKPILSDSGYISEMLSSSQNSFTGYGYLWWLNGTYGCGPGRTPDDCETPRTWINTAPDDVVGMSGALGRYLFVAPELGIVVARIGDDAAFEGEEFPSEFWGLLLGVKD